MAKRSRTPTKQDALSKALLDTAATSVLTGKVKAPKSVAEGEAEVYSRTGKNLRQL